MAGSSVPVLDLRLVSHFVAVADQRSFTRAAQLLGITQSALSQSIKTLEQRVGGLLIRRSPGTFALTEAGAGLYADGVPLLDGAERALRRARRSHASSATIALAIGFGSSTSAPVTTALSGSAAASDDLEVTLVHVRWGQELRDLDRGGVDLVLMHETRHIPGERYSVLRLRSQPLYAALPSGHALSTRQSLKITDLADEPIMDAATDREYWLVDPRPGNHRPRVVHPAASTVEEMLIHVAAARGMAITAEAVARSNGRCDVAFVPITDLPPVQEVAVRLLGDDRLALRHLLVALERATA